MQLKILTIYLTKQATDYPFASINKATVESLPYENNFFDFIWCGHVLHYLDNWTTAIDEIKRVLKPGGTGAISVHHPLEWGLSQLSEEQRLLGFVNKSEVGNYLQNRKVNSTWYNKYEVTYYSKSIAESLNQFINKDLTIKQVVEGGVEEDSRLPILLAFSFSK